MRLEEGFLRAPALPVEPTMTDLRGITSAVIRRAERQGYVVPREVRAALASAGLPEGHWKDVVAQARESLTYRHGRYYYINPLRPSHLQGDQRQALDLAVRELIRRHQDQVAAEDRRQEERISIVQPVVVRTGDGRVLRLLSRDLSPTGIRLVGTRSLLGQKVRVELSRGDGLVPLALLVRILWTGTVGDGLFENGGSFLEIVAAGEPAASAS
jgi:hypothetical protein